MKEAEWLECKDPEKMLDFLRRRRRRKPSDRKLRLFAVACVRHVWHLLSDERFRKAVEVAERHADAAASLTEMSAAGNIASIPTPSRLDAAVEAADSAARASAFSILSWAATAVIRDAAEAVFHAAPNHGKKKTRAAEGAYQTDLFRDIFGSLPFRPMTIDDVWLSWNGGTIPQLARAIYDERRFHDLPILADALEVAGCTNADLLAHCRGPGPHVRGCWVLDLILRKK